jgi:hypothetical protein
LIDCGVPSLVRTRRKRRIQREGEERGRRERGGETKGDHMWEKQV